MAGCESATRCGRLCRPALLARTLRYWVFSFIEGSLMAREVSGSRAYSSVSWPVLHACMASAVPHAPPGMCMYSQRASPQANCLSGLCSSRCCCRRMPGGMRAKDRAAPPPRTPTLVSSFAKHPSGGGAWSTTMRARSCWL
jgi:hypothetical protein